LFKKATAKFSLLLLAFCLLPSGMLRADDSVDIITSSDPQPVGNPKPNAIDSPLWLELELGILMAL